MANVGEMDPCRVGGYMKGQWLVRLIVSRAKLNRGSSFLKRSFLEELLCGVCMSHTHILHCTLLKLPYKSIFLLLNS
jgi:hypothetical protein